MEDKKTFFKKKEASPEKAGFIKIKPKKDFKIVQNGIEIIIKKGREIEVPVKYEANLKTEKVI